MMTTIDDDIADPKIYADLEAYHALFSRLRREEPVRWTVPSRYRPFWTIAKHADIVEIQRQPVLFPSAPRTQLNTIEAEQQIQAATGGRTQVHRSMLSMDGEEHKALRNISREWFLPRNINKLENDIAVIANRSIDAIDANGGVCDFADDIAVWYPLRVILHIFGLPAEEEPRMLRLSKEFGGAQDPDFKRSQSQGDHTLQVMQEFFSFFAELAAERRANPQDDLASVIANAKPDGEPLSDLLVFSYYILICVAGHDTTSASIARGLLALIENPAEWAKLKSDPELLSTAADEMVRWAHPVKHFFRTAAQDYELRGQKIRAGDNLLMAYPSACRDEEVFETPFEFHVDRAPNPHLAFGIGPHLCLGQYLAKVEIVTFFRELLQRYDGVELLGTPAERQSLSIGGLKRLPVRFIRAQAVAAQ